MGRVSTNRDGEGKRQLGGSAIGLSKHTADTRLAGSGAALRPDLRAQPTGDSDLALSTRTVGDPGPWGRLPLLGATGRGNKSGHFKEPNSPSF